MPTDAASGSGEPLERSDYTDGATLPRSGLLEPCLATDRPTAALRLLLPGRLLLALGSLSMSARFAGPIVLPTVTAPHHLPTRP
jgi:hypothetical protein